MTTYHDESRLMSPAALAAYLGRSVAALAQMRYRGTGPRYIHAGGRVRYRPEDVEAWLHAGEREST